MQKYDFLLMYEHKVRELDNLCLLKYELDKRGYKTKILYVNDYDLVQSRTIVYETKVLVIGYCYTSSSIKDYASYRIKFDKVVNMQWEQVISIEQENNSNSYRNLSGLAKEIVHISWGERNQKRLIEKAGVLPEKVKVTGNITLDFLRPELKGFYLSKEEVCGKYQLPEEKKICLFIAGFKFIEVSEEEKEANIKCFGEGRRHYLEVAEKEQITILQWFEQILKEHDEYLIVYRPHPGDVSKRAQALADRFDNFRVISELSVKQWIVISDLVYAWNSTAILEAFFAGKNPFFLCPYPIPEDQMAPLLIKMNKVTDYKTFEQTLLGKKINMGLTKELVNPFYLIDEEKASYIKIVDALEEVFKDSCYKLNRKQKKEYQELYSLKDRAIIQFMRMKSFYSVYLWILDNVPFQFVKRRKQWLEGYQAKEQNRWKAMNDVEVGNYHNETEIIICRIKSVLES